MEEGEVEIETNAALKKRAAKILSKLGCDLPSGCDSEMVLTALRLLQPAEYHAAKSRAVLLGGRQRWRVMREACDRIVVDSPALFLP